MIEKGKKSNAPKLLERRHDRPTDANRSCNQTGWLSTATQGEQDHNRREPQQRPALFELAVLAAPAVEPDMHRTAITLRLARNAGPDPGKRTAARFRDFVTAFQAMALSDTRRHARPRSHDAVYDGIVDLVLHRPVA